ncbi:MarR family winged helix-turn-helix transcriptional regulator [Pseudalkalibacillus hwajinpoensis]|uniref:MarR family winged helix-turn-helix transcriptional regulator n=1 Tax=Guptibacillus hwajinpoensis TaxID=208199 RepID=UPI001CFD81C2|nr:MarR family transcriptional regulator [Pseudalkalibacillus hwajinpoensis]
MQEEEKVLMQCLFFTSNRFARNITKLAEKNFDFSDLAPSYFYMIMVIHGQPNITQKELCQKLSIAPSTSTRFIEKLVKQNLVRKQTSGKQTMISLTEDGEALYVAFRKGLKSLFEDYNEILGKELSMNLSLMLHEASQKLEKNN